MPEQNNPIILQANTWSELPGVLQEFIRISGNDDYRIFGYGSLVWNHEELRQGNPNEPENAVVNGACVNMDIFAAGEREFRASDVSTGLYIGMSPTGNPDDKTVGKNILVAPDKFKEAVKSFVLRELGKVPEGLDINRLFDADAAEYFGQLSGKDSDKLKLYTLQITNTEVNGEIKPALVVSSNTNSVFYAGNLTPRDAAQCILDGQAYRYVRSEGGSVTGGTALEYFTNQVKGFRERGIYHPRIEEIAAEVVKLAGHYSEVAALLKDIEQLNLLEDSDKDLGKLYSLCQDRDNLYRNELIDLTSPFFPKETSFVDRLPVTEEARAAATFPRKGQGKIDWVAQIADGRAGISSDQLKSLVR